MANTAPKKFTSAFTMRVDDQFTKSIGELQEYMRNPTAPPVSEVIRIAVNEALEKRRKASKRKEG